MFLATSGTTHGQPILLLHGGGVAGWMWNSLRDRLDASYHVLVPDLPGHGRSADEPYVSHGDTVTAITEMLSAIVPGKRVTVIGFSLGAQLSLQLASIRPDLVSETIVVSAQARRMPFTSLTLRTLGVTAPLARRPWFAKLQARELFIPPHLIDEYIETSAGITKETLLTAVGENLRFVPPAAWSEFRGRALVMVGAKERRLMRDSAAIIHAGLPGSELSIVDGCGHGIPLQQPDWFADTVLEWLARR